MTDAERLEAAIRRQHSQRAPCMFADEIAKTIGIQAKVCQRILLKWTRQEKWEYGVSARSGWFRDGIGAYHGHKEKADAGGDL